MMTAFNVEKIRPLLQDFYAISHIRITVFDEELHELVSYPEEAAPYCRIIRSKMKGYEACLACDREACETAKKTRETWIYQCHAGFTEAVTPLFVGDILAGYVLFGHVFSYADPAEGWAVIQERTAPLHLQSDRLQKALREAQPISESYVRSAARILHAVASYLILAQMAGLQEEALPVRLDRYLSAHFTEDLTTPDLCETFGIGRTRLYEIARQLYGCGVAGHIRNLRMALARRLLAGSEKLSLNEIAERCGYHDYNYFISVFTRENGCAPGTWRRQQAR